MIVKSYMDIISSVCITDVKVKLSDRFVSPNQNFLVTLIVIYKFFYLEYFYYLSLFFRLYYHLNFSLFYL